MIAARLSKLATIVMAIEAQQEAHPGFCDDILMAIVNSELKRLQEEQEREQNVYERNRNAQ